MHCEDFCMVHTATGQRAPWLKSKRHREQKREERGVKHRAEEVPEPTHGPGPESGS